MDLLFLIVVAQLRTSPQLFERGAEDYVDRGRRGVAGRARWGVIGALVGNTPSEADSTLAVAS